MENCHKPDAGNFREGRLKWRLLNLTASHKRFLPAKIDLTHDTFLRPYAVACLCALGCKAKKRCRLKLPVDQKCRDHLLRMGVTRWFVCETTERLQTPRGTNVVVEHLEDKPGKSADRIIDLLIEDNSIGPGEAPLLKDHLDEVIWNALTHSGSRVGCFVAGQLFPQMSMLELAVLDLGCTIPVHLRKNPKWAELRTAREAVLRATENGVTGTCGKNKWGQVNSGAGLHELRRFCEDGRAEMVIVTGPVIGCFGEKEPQFKKFFGGFAGCLVNLRFRLNCQNDSTNSIINSKIW